MAYKFTADKWDSAITEISNKLIRITDPEYEWDYDSFNDAKDTVSLGFISQPDISMEEILVNDQMISKCSADMVDSFCPTEDMGEYVESYSFIHGIIIEVFEEFGEEVS